MTNTLGSVTDSLAYDSFGALLSVAGTTINPFRYLVAYGYYYDTDTTYYLALARYYNPQNGRWLSSLIAANRDVNMYVVFHVNPLTANASVLGDTPGLETKDCSTRETDCIQRAVKVAIDTLRGKDCFGKLLKGHQHCPADQLTDCLVAALNMMVVTCADLQP